MMSNEQRGEYLAALHRERESHERAGDKARVADVCAEIRRVEGDPPRKRAERRQGR